MFKIDNNELVKLLDEAYLDYIKFPATELKVSSYRPIKYMLMEKLIILDYKL